MKSMKLIQYIGYGFLGISVIVVVTFFATSDFAAKEYPMSDLLLNWTYIMLGLASIAAVGMPLINLVKDPKQLVRSLSGIGIVAVVLLICYLMADSTPVTLADGEVRDNVTELKLSDTGLFATYFAFIVTIVAIVGGEIWKIIKNR